MRRLVATPARLHGAVLAVGFVLLTLGATTQFLFYDDWAFIAQPAGSALEPHMGHLSVTPHLLFRGILAVFGANSSLPFALPMILAHVALVHLVWRACVRVGVEAWTAALLSALLMFLGAGGENILWPFQVGFVGAAALALVALVAIDRERLGWRWFTVAAAAAAAAVTFSGTAIPVLGAVAVVAIVRHGWLRAAAVMVPAAAIYGAWMLAIGLDRPVAPGRAHGAEQLLKDVPRYALRMLTDGLGSVSPVAVVGTLGATVLLVWALLTFRSVRGAAAAAYALGLGGVAFALMTAYSRVDFGMEAADASRYVYLVVFCFAPLAGLAVTRLMTAKGVALRSVTVVLGLLVAYNAALLGAWGVYRARIGNDTEARLSAALALADEYPGRFPLEVQPYPEWAPDVTLGTLIDLGASGRFKPAGFDDVASLSVRVNLDVTVTTLPVAEEREGCILIPAGTGIDLPWPDAVIVSDVSTTVTFALTDDGVMGDSRAVAVPAPGIRMTQSLDATVAVLATGRDVLACPRA